MTPYPLRTWLSMAVLASLVLPQPAVASLCCADQEHPASVQLQQPCCCDEPSACAISSACLSDAVARVADEQVVTRTLAKARLDSSLSLPVPVRQLASRPQRTATDPPQPASRGFQIPLRP